MIYLYLIIVVLISIGASIESIRRNDLNFITSLLLVILFIVCSPVVIPLYSGVALIKILEND